jgi:hypothetical protein
MANTWDQVVDSVGSPAGEKNMRTLASIVVGLYSTGVVFGIALGFVPIAAADDGDDDPEGNCIVNFGATCKSDGECIVNGGIPTVREGSCGGTCLVNFAGNCEGECIANIVATCELMEI